MSITFTKYFDITSSVGGATLVSGREFIGRLFTTNPLLPTGTLQFFTSASQVGAYYGLQSEEYLRSVAYFSRVSKRLTRAQKISFARWADVNVAPRIYGTKVTAPLSTFTAIANGSFILTIGGVSNTINGLDFTGAVSLAAVAAIIQTAVRTNTGIQWTAATVTYNNTRASFDFVGGDAVVATISTAAGPSGTNIRTLLGWGDSATYSSGSLAQSITSLLDDSTSANNNFGSFIFIPTLSLDETTEAAAWTKAQNVRYLYFPTVASEDVATYSTALIDYDGTGLILAGADGDYVEQLPMEVFATTDYNATNSVQNYMYQQDPTLTPNVTDAGTSDTLDALRVNYYGETQQGGQAISFFQRGVLMGGATAPQFMNIYANEIWLKDAAGVALAQLFLSRGRVPANTQGTAQCDLALQGVIDRALNNGTISVGKTLTVDQIAFINDFTGDDNAWHQVQNAGYYYRSNIVPYVAESGLTEYKLVYSLIYSKDDAVLKVVGEHILI